MNVKQKLYDLLGQHKAKVGEAQVAVDAGDLDKAESLTKEAGELAGQIEKVKALIAEQERFGGSGEGEEEPKPAQKALQLQQEGGEDGYQKAVKAFAQAAREGFPRQKAETTPAAPTGHMREGSDPDGGYTVPEDIVTKIIALRESKESLLGEVRVIPVKTRSGRRTIKKRGQHQGFATVAEAAKFGKTSTPQFTTLSYEVEKRGGYLPITSELLEDSDNNIASVAQEWLADEARVTANKEILAVIQAKTAQDLKDLDGILKAWVDLGSTFRAASKLITNDDGLLWLGTLKDENGRYLLTPNPAEPHQLRLCVGPYTLPVKTYDNETIPTADGKIPMILGDLKEGVVYWDRRQFSVKVSDVAVVGDFNAFEQDMTIWRGSLRDDCTSWDDAAFVNGYISQAAEQTGGTEKTNEPADEETGE